MTFESNDCREKCCRPSNTHEHRFINSPSNKKLSSSPTIFYSPSSERESEKQSLVIKHIQVNHNKVDPVQNAYNRFDDIIHKLQHQQVLDNQVRRVLEMPDTQTMTFLPKKTDTPDALDTEFEVLSISD